jgi:ABC-type lipoprotein export system ATPase subunit
MQRTAIARALVSRPRVLFADEPTGNLDAESGGEIVRLLRSLNHDDGVTILMVTHNLELVRHTDRVVRMTAGRLCDQPPGLADPLVEAAA